MAGHLALWDPPQKNASLKKENLCEGRENTQMPLIPKNISLYKLSLIQFKVSLLYLCVSGVSDKASAGRGNCQFKGFESQKEMEGRAKRGRDSYAMHSYIQQKAYFRYGGYFFILGIKRKKSGYGGRLAALNLMPIAAYSFPSDCFV